MSRVVTGEAVALDLRVAQLPSRVIAALLDFLAMGLGLLILTTIAGQLLVGSNEATQAAVVIIMIVGVFLGYPLAFEALTRGRTPGKMVMGLRVVRDDGGPIVFRQALVRSVVGLTLERPGVILLGLGGPALAMFVMLFSKDGKRIGDAWAGTIVLQERVGRRPLFMPFVPAPLVAWAPNLDLTDLDDALALAVRQYLSRIGELDEAARAALGQRLAAEVAACTTPPPPPYTPDWAYLLAVLAERRRRAEVQLAALRQPVGQPPRQPVGIR